MASKLTPLSTSYHSFQTDQVLTETQLNEFLNYFDDQIRLSRVMLSGVGIACGFELRYESGNRFSFPSSFLSNVKSELSTSKDVKIDLSAPLSSESVASTFKLAKGDLSSLKTEKSEAIASIESKLDLSSLFEEIASTKKILQNPRIVIKQGVGVTTDGDELHLLNTNADGEFALNTNEIAYTHYKLFQDTNAKYSHFSNEKKVLTIYELIPSNSKKASKEESLLSTLDNFTQMVVMLYLESFPDEKNTCGSSCDNQGIQQVANLKVLLVSQEDAAHILTKDSIYNKHNLLPTYATLDDLSVKRVVLAAHTKDENFDLAELYNLENEGDLINRLKINLQAIENKIGQYLPIGLMTRIKSNMNIKLAPGSLGNTHFQYKYDLLKDVVDTYNELKEQFIQFSSECFPDLDAFPKHLMLGIVSPTAQEAEQKKFRHSFYKSSLFDSQMGAFKSFLFLLNRLDNQLRFGVRLPFGSTSFTRNEIRLTPSKLNTLLGNRAIPYYYDPNLNFLKTWSEDKTLRNKYARNLTYHISALDNVPTVQTPLQFDLDSYDFLRIEGHQGKELVEVMTEIDKQKIEYGLAFDLKAVALDANIDIETDYEKYACQFEDLQVMLEAWQQEQECALKKATELLSSFSIVRPGKNLQEDIIVKPIGTKSTLTLPKDLVSFKDLATTQKLGLESSEKSSETLKTTSSKESLLDFSSSAIFTPLSITNVTPFTPLSPITAFKAPNPVVVESLAKESETVGAAMQYAIGNNTLAEPSDLIISADYYADFLIKELNVTWPKPQRNLLLTNSFTLLSYARALNDSIPSSIPELNTTVIDSYEIKVQNLCKAVQKAQLDYANSEALSELDSGEMSKNKVLFNMAVNMLANTCCTIGKIQSLLDAIEKRKESILSQLLLKNMVEKHPSMEHTGGVKMGGTFILVYDSNTSLVKGIPPTKRVIADFSLPYLCCSDCAPIQFIVEQPKVKLRLPTHTLCLGADPINLTFQVEPVDGEIKTDRDIPGLTIEGLVLSIDPATFPESEMGQKIDFMVNQQLTDCRLTVHKLLDATFLVPSTLISNPEVSFAPLQNHPEGTNYLWSFGDGNTSTDKEVKHVYNFKAGEEKTLIVSLTVTTKDGGCVSYHSEKITISQRALSMKKISFCEDDGESYEITLIPAGSGEINWDGGTGNNFIPANAKPNADGIVPISVDGQELLFVKICPEPNLAAVITYTSSSVVLTRPIKTKDIASWTFFDRNGNEVSPAINNAGFAVSIPIKTLLTILKEGDITATLTVTNNCCEKSQNYTIKIPEKAELTCEATATAAINAAMAALDTKINDGIFMDKLTSDQIAFFTQAQLIHQAVNDNLVDALSGKLNNNLMDNLLSIFNGIYSDYTKNTPNDFQKAGLAFLFANLFELYLKVIQCQPESEYEQPGLTNIMGKLTAFFDRQNPDSFTSLDIDVDLGKVFVSLVTTTLSYRTDKSNSQVMLMELLSKLNS
jgi:PKD domain